MAETTKKHWFKVISPQRSQIDKQPRIMSKRKQEGKPETEERMVAKSKPMMSLVSKIANRSPTLDLGASNSPGTFGLSSISSDRSGTGKPVAKGVKCVSENVAPSSQV